MARQVSELMPVRVVLADATGVDVAIGNPVPVAIAAGGADADVNIASVNGVATPVGHGTAATALRVELPTDGTGKVGLNTQGCNSSATFTPAASSHTANDVVGGAQTFATFAPAAGNVMITGASLTISSANAQVSTWRLYLYSVTPPSASADDAAWDLPSGDRASFLGYIDIGTAVDLGSTQFVQVSGINLEVTAASTSLFGYLVNGTTLSTEAVAHLVKLVGVAL